MKITSKFLITTAILCFVNLIAMAKESSVFSVQATDENTMTLQVTNVNQAQIQVTLKDVHGLTLYDETLSNNNVNHRKYDLQNLPLGSYMLIVAYDNVIKVQEVNKQPEGLEIEADRLQTIFQPTFVEHSEYVDLNMLCSSNQNISLEMSDSEGHVIYTEHNQFKGSFKKRFNLSKLDEGSYTFTLRIIGTVINKEFEQTINWSPAIAAL